jgi:hypothetical protein
MSQGEHRLFGEIHHILATKLKPTVLTMVIWAKFSKNNPFYKSQPLFKVMSGKKVHLKQKMM